MGNYGPIDFPRPLTSWTRTLPQDEGLALIDLAVPGEAAEDWRNRCEALLDTAEPSYRQTLIRLVQRIFIETDGADTVLDTPMLRLIQSGPETRRNDIFFSRYGLAHPWTLLAVQELVAPRLAAAEAAGAAPEAIPMEDWDALVDRFTEEEASAASRRKTRSSVIGVLVQLGVLERDGASSAPARPRRARPDPLAYGLTVAEQLSGQLLLTLRTAEVVAHSDASRLWCPSPDYAEACLRAAVALDVLVATKVEGQPALTLSAAEKALLTPQAPAEGQGAEAGA